MKGVVLGVGINDSPTPVSQTTNGVKTYVPSYLTWKSILTRCYCARYHLYRPTYKGSIVCEEWKVYSRFKEWFGKHCVDGWHIEKDILSGEQKRYSPETCVFIPQYLNSFLNDHGNARGECKLGVSKKKTKSGDSYYANCNNPRTVKTEPLGRFPTEQQAHVAWFKAKLKFAEMLKEDFDNIDKRLFPRVVEIIKGKFSE